MTQPDLTAITPEKTSDLMGIFDNELGQCRKNAVSHLKTAGVLFALCGISAVAGAPAAALGISLYAMGFAGASMANFSRSISMTESKNKLMAPKPPEPS
jgi:amino acid transporter